MQKSGRKKWKCPLVHLATGRIHGRGRSPPSPLEGCWPKNWDARPIKSRFYQSQNAPKLAFLSSKIGKFYGEGHNSPRWGWEHPIPTTHLPPLDSGAYGARLDCLRRLGPRRLHSRSPPPSHTWILPCLLETYYRWTECPLYVLNRWKQVIT